VKRIDIDAGLFEGYGGNRAFLVIEDNAIKVQVKNEDEEWEEENLGDFAGNEGGLYYSDDEAVSSAPVESSAPQVVKKSARIGGGTRAEGFVFPFVNSAWIEAGSFKYRVWVTDDTFNFQRYDKSGVNLGGR